MKEIYLDNAATTMVYPQVVEKMNTVLSTGFYNPSSFYKPSVEIEKAVEEARRNIAHTLSSYANELYFTSGATESNNTIIKGAVDKARGDFNIITSSIEHPSVMEVFKYLGQKGVDVRYIPVDGLGNLDLNWLEDNTDKNTALISVMGANNEIGTIADLNSIRGIIDQKAPKAIFHTDFTQSYLKSTDSRLNLKTARPDAISVSAHKIHGPKGIGAMMIRKGTRVSPLLLGGGQENNFRSGTENVPGIIGFSTAVERLSKNVKENEEKLQGLKTRLLDGLKDVQDVIVNTPPDGLPGLLSLSVLGIKSEVLLHMLESKNIYIAAGSACSTHHKDSYVHKALGYDNQRSEGTVRISMSEFTTEEDIDTLTEEMESGIKELRKVMGFKKKR